jgi:hypothetical protein
VIFCSQTHVSHLFSCHACVLVRTPAIIDRKTFQLKAGATRLFLLHFTFRIPPASREGVACKGTQSTKESHISQTIFWFSHSSLVHTGLGSSSLVAHVLPYPHRPIGTAVINTHTFQVLLVAAAAPGFPWLAATSQPRPPTIDSDTTFPWIVLHRTRSLLE